MMRPPQGGFDMLVFLRLRNVIPNSTDPRIPSPAFPPRASLSPTALRWRRSIGTRKRWNHSVRAVFRRLEPAVWKASGFNPIVMLGRVSQEVLERAAGDPRFLALYRKACEMMDAYLAAKPADKPPMLTAYFSMEYGLIDCMPIYSGGLGVLSGDHLKASSDALLPLVGVGLLYQRGYLQQTLDPDGWQEERTPLNDFYALPVTPVMREGKELIVTVSLAGTPVHAKVEMEYDCASKIDAWTNTAHVKMDILIGHLRTLRAGLKFIRSRPPDPRTPA